MLYLDLDSLFGFSPLLVPSSSASAIILSRSGNSSDYSRWGSDAWVELVKLYAILKIRRKNESDVEYAKIRRIGIQDQNRTYQTAALATVATATRRKDNKS